VVRQNHLLLIFQHEPTVNILNLGGYSFNLILRLQIEVLKLPDCFPKTIANYLFANSREVTEMTELIQVPICDFILDYNWS
jgi:hypothetical protein